MRKIPACAIITSPDCPYLWTSVQGTGVLKEVKGSYLTSEFVCTQTTVILIFKRFEKIGVVPFTLFVHGKYFMPLMPSASHHSSLPHETNHQTWHCLCCACPFHPCSSFTTKETLPYVTVGTTPPVLKVSVTFQCFPLVSLAMMPEQQDFVPGTQDHSSSMALGDVAESSTSWLQLREGKIVKTSQRRLSFAVPAAGVAASCPASLHLLSAGDEASLLLTGAEGSVPSRAN